MRNSIFRVSVEGGELAYDLQTNKWSGEPADALTQAREMRKEYTYSPADGYPGFRHVGEVAEKIGGEVVMTPTIPPVEEGADY